MTDKPEWIKTKGYLHITPTLNIEKNWKKYFYKITSPKYVATYAFYPLMHRIIKQRRYKKPDASKHKGEDRAHCHKNKDTGKTDLSVKKRPLHYATHFDALIYAYYAEILKELYEQQLHSDPELDKAVLAYRSIPVSDTDFKGKSNIHFAKEAFEEIKRRVETEGETAVLAMDLKSFFSSLSHEWLYQSWAQLLKVNKLPPDHANVFKACTHFSYLLWDDLKINGSRYFDESKLAEIRKKSGFRSFFATNQEFRKAIKEGQLPIYKNPFRRENKNGEKEMVGIPQGLPISAILANLYLLEFDKKIIENLVGKEGISYRRYSDDILICCSQEQMAMVEAYIKELIARYKIILSEEKTEYFLFKNYVYNQSGEERLASIKLEGDKQVIGSPLTYLGFEFRGYNTVIKSANLAKFYRRLIEITKRRSRRAIQLSERDPTIPRAVYLNQVKKLYNSPLRYAQKTENKQVFRKRYKLVVNDRGDFEFEHFDHEGRNSNYISYIRRCDKIFGTKDFSRQLKKKRQIIGQAINRHLLDKKDKHQF